MHAPHPSRHLVISVVTAVLLGLASGALAAPAPRPDTPAGDAQAQALARASNAVLGVSARATDGALSSDTLGRERRGSGVVIDDGLVLTIGYLILEAEDIDLHPDNGGSVPARMVAYDVATGFGLLQALLPLRLAPVPLGNALEVADSEPLMFASGADGQGTAGSLSVARLASRRPFSGYWEYHIEGALFTVPARPDHSGAGLFNARGELVGIGSLLVTDVLGKSEARHPGNMFVPVDLLKPILSELRERGSSRASMRAWLGLNCQESEGAVRVIRVSKESPAEEAGLEPGDLILKIDGVAVQSLEQLYKTLWSNETPERDVAIEISRGADFRTLNVRAVDRMKTLRKAKGI
jgi:serine protease Do